MEYIKWVDMNDCFIFSILKIFFLLLLNLKLLFLIICVKLLINNYDMLMIFVVGGVMVYCRE